MNRGSYDIAQVCLNGHVANAQMNEYPERNRFHCTECGERTMDACADCGVFIRGYYRAPGVFPTFKYSLPNFCHNCGSAYPWTERRLKAARQMTTELQELSAEEKDTLNDSLSDMIRDTPQAEVAALRFKKILVKASTEAGTALRALVIDFASETARKILTQGPGP